MSLKTGSRTALANPANNADKDQLPDSKEIDSFCSKISLFLNTFKQFT